MGQSPRPAVVAAALVAGIAARSAEGASPAVRLDWMAPQGCLSRDEALEDIGRTLGSSHAPAVIDARVVIAQEGESFEADIELAEAGTKSMRRLDADSCRAVADAAVFVIALAVNPDAALTAPPPEEPPTQAQLLPADTVPTPPAPFRRPLSLGTAIVVDTGLLPSTSYGAGLKVGWERPRLGVEVDGAFLAVQTATLASIPSQGARFWLAHVGARACYEPFDARFDLGPCLGGGFEWLIASGFGSPPDQPKNATGQMPVGTAGAKATLRLSSRVFVGLWGEAVVPFERPRFVIDGGGFVFQSGAASFRAAAGAETHF